MKRSQSFDALIDRWGVSALQVAPRVLCADLPALGAAGFGETWWSPVRRRVGKSSICSTWKTIGKPWENGKTWENHRKTQRKMDVNPLANCPITMENHNFSWNPLFLWPFSIAMFEGSLEVKLPTIWTVEKQRWEESEEKRSEERRCRCAKR